MGEIREKTGNERLAFYSPTSARSRRCECWRSRSSPSTTGSTSSSTTRGLGTRGRTGSERELSQDGYELRFAIMYLAPYLLTQLLGAAAGLLSAGADRQRGLRGPISDRLRRRDARARLQRRPGVLLSKTALVMLTFDLADELRDGE